MNSKKFGSIILLSSVLFTGCSATEIGVMKTDAKTTVQNVKYKSSDFGYKEVSSLIKQGIIKDVSISEFKPNSYITRTNAIKWLSSATNKTNLNSVKTSTSSLTKSDVALLLSKAFDLKGKYPAKIADVKKGSSIESAARLAVGAEAIQLDNNAKFNPTTKVKRADFAVFMHKIINKTSNINYEGASKNISDYNAKLKNGALYFRVEGTEKYKLPSEKLNPGLNAQVHNIISELNDKKYYTGYHHSYGVTSAAPEVIYIGYNESLQHYTNGNPNFYYAFNINKYYNAKKIDKKFSSKAFARMYIYHLYEIPKDLFTLYLLRQTNQSFDSMSLQA